jgi:hypothetical protein
MAAHQGHVVARMRPQSHHCDCGMKPKKNIKKESKEEKRKTKCIP